MRQRIPWVSVLAIAATAGALYAPVVAGMVRQWYDEPDNSQGFLLAFAAIAVLWRRRRTLATTPAAPSNVGLAALVAALIVYALGSLVGDLFLIRLSLPLTIAAAVLFMLGTRHARALLPAIGLLCLSIPLPAVLVTHLTMPLQLMASQMAAGMLAVCGVPVVRAGNLLMLPHITLEVAEACSGLRSVTSLISVAAVCGALVPLGTRRTLVLIAAALPIAIVGNGVRVAATGLLTTWIGEIAVRGTLHELTGYVAFLAMCAAAFIVDAMTRGRMHRWRTA